MSERGVNKVSDFWVNTKKGALENQEIPGRLWSGRSLRQ